MTDLLFDLARALLASGLMTLVLVGLGVGGALRLSDERRVGAVGTRGVALAFFAVHLVELGRYALHLPGYAGTLVLLALALLGLRMSRAELRELWRRPDVRETGGAMAALAAGLLGLTMAIHTFGGADWQMDWIGHYDRALHWLALSPEVPFGYGDNIPSRSPLANHGASAFLAVAGPNLAAYQLAMTLAAALFVLPLRWALEQAERADDAAVWFLGALLLAHPLFVQNATYPWTKLPEAFFVVAGLLAARERLLGRGPRHGSALAMALLGAAVVTHYAAIPFALATGLALCVAELRARRPLALGAMLGALVVTVGPWLLTSSVLFGAELTFAPFMGLEHDPARVARAAGDVFATLVPHPLRGVPVDAIEQSSALGMTRDQLFLVYQTCAPLSAGLAGLVAALTARARLRERAAWLALGLFVLSFAAYAHPLPTPFGLAHLSVAPLAILTAALVPVAATRGRPWLASLGVALALDLTLGVGLHLGLESAPIELDAGLGAELSAGVRANRRLALDAGLQTLGERLGPLRYAGFAVALGALVALVRRARVSGRSAP